jgi:hypothetical protein
VGYPSCRYAHEVELKGGHVEDLSDLRTPDGVPGFESVGSPEVVPDGPRPGKHPASYRSRWRCPSATSGSDHREPRPFVPATAYGDVDVGNGSETGDDDGTGVGARLRDLDDV